MQLKNQDGGISSEKPIELEALQICDLIDKLVRDIVVKNELKAKVLHFCCRAVSMQRTEKEARG